MVCKELSLLQHVGEKNELQDFEDADDALSLCDLPLNSKGSADWSDDFSKTDQSSYFEDDLFEFFSEDFTASTYSSDNSNSIIFCGKLIPYKGAEKAQSLASTVKEKHNKKSRIFPWKSSESFNKTRTLSSKQQLQEKRLNKGCVSGKGDEFSVKRVPLLATPMKSRWYLFAFGVGRFPMEMELSDMRTRQSKKSPARKAEMSSSPNGRETSRRGGRKGLWRLLRVLGCKSKHSSDVSMLNVTPELEPGMMISNAKAFPPLHYQT